MSNECAGSARVAFPLFQAGGGGSSPAPALHVRDLEFAPCPKSHAVALVRAWHSRLPNVQSSPWQFAFHAQRDGVSYAVALWNNPSGRCLPHHWLELRRMACASDAPRNTASAFLAWMVRWFRVNAPERERCISYQDTAVHAGTMYRAAGWKRDAVAKFRVRDRSGNRAGTGRKYRASINGEAPDAAEKVRWAVELVPPRGLPAIGAARFCAGAPLPTDAPETAAQPTTDGSAA